MVGCLNGCLSLDDFGLILEDGRGSGGLRK